jgi:hypothetical protein
LNLALYQRNTPTVLQKRFTKTKKPNNMLGFFMSDYFCESINLGLYSKHIIGNCEFYKLCIIPMDIY